MKKNFKKVANQKFDSVIKTPDYITSIQTKSSFPTWGKIAIFSGALVSAAAVALVVILPLSLMNNGVSSANKNYEERTTFNMDKKAFSAIDINIANMNTLNDISYPLNQEIVPYTNLEKDAYINFVYEFAKASNYKSFSPISLYSVLYALKGGISDEELYNKMDVLLGNEINQNSFYKKLIANNFGVYQNGTTQIHNGAFFNNANPDYTYNPNYINYLNTCYFEAYELNFNTSANKIVEWVNESLQSDGFIDESFLEMQDDTALYLMSTMLFDHHWLYKYISDNNIVDKFYLSNGTTIDATYMKHDYCIDNYYLYDKYVSFIDRYENGYTINYLVPRSVNDNILDVIKDKNFLIEDENNIVEPGKYGVVYVDLETPKFDQKIENKFNDALVTLGFGKMFDDNYDTLGNCFIDTYDSYNAYLQNVKQKNEMKFNEDGSLLKTVVEVEMGYGGSAEPSIPGEEDAADDPNRYLNVKLNQPFVYIIKDASNLPIFVGYMENPK